MKTIESKIVINTPVETVWNVLTDFENMPQWNPFVKGISGSKVTGSRLQLTLIQPENKIKTINPEIIVYHQYEEIRLLGKYKITGLFDNEYYFLLHSIDNQHTKVIHGERFSGILLPLFRKKFVSLLTCFELINDCLKNRCEEYELDTKKIKPLIETDSASQ